MFECIRVMSKTRNGKLLKVILNLKTLGAVKAKHDKRIIVNAIFYLVKGGIQWRMFPKDFPPWKTVYDYFRTWCREGLWETILDQLNIRYRQQKGRSSMPTNLIPDRPCVRKHSKIRSRID